MRLFLVIIISLVCVFSFAEQEDDVRIRNVIRSFNTTGDHTFANVILTGDLSLSNSSVINLGTTGVKLSTDGDGAITYTGLSAGYDESLTWNFDDYSNSVYVTSSTGVSNINIFGCQYKPDSIELNATGSGNRYAYVDFIGDDTYTDYGLRLIRENTGANAISRLEHKGTGELQIKAVEAAQFSIYTSDTERFRVNGSDGSTNTYANGATYAARFSNDGNNAARYGLRVQAGADDGSGTTNYFRCSDGDDDEVGGLRNNSGTFELYDVSDIATKKNITETKINGKDIISNIQIKEFERLNHSGVKINGIIAQDLELVYPSAVSVNPETGLKAISRDALIIPLIKCVQELQLKVDDLVKRIEELEK